MLIGHLTPSEVIRGADEKVSLKGYVGMHGLKYTCKQGLCPCILVSKGIHFNSYKIRVY